MSRAGPRRPERSRLTPAGGWAGKVVGRYAVDRFLLAQGLNGYVGSRPEAPAPPLPWGSAQLGTTLTPRPQRRSPRRGRLA